MIRAFLTAAVVSSFLLASCGQQRPAASTALRPSELLADRARYNGRKVGVEGTIALVLQKVSPGTTSSYHGVVTSSTGDSYTIAMLCDSGAPPSFTIDCVRVFTRGHPPMAEGEVVTVIGTFATAKHVGPVIIHNEVEANALFSEERRTQQR